MRKRILLGFGTRPEAIKMAPVYWALRAAPDSFDVSCCVTAQHREMLDQALRSFGIVPDFDLDLMRGGQNLTDVHAGVLAAVRAVLAEAKPDVVLVHGDTTTTMATALAAFYAGIAVGHVEAGLRSGSLDAPFPEELNRRVTDMVARYHFAPTNESAANLLREGVEPASVIVTGNTVVDALRFVLARSETDPELRRAIGSRLDASLGFDWRADRFVLVTCHRRENAAGHIEAICAALDRLADAHPDVHFLLPVHPNPAVRRQIEARLTGRRTIHLVEPLRYEDFLFALRRCHCVLTDSGGLQEEGPCLDKPVLVMRETTERPEAVQSGGVRLVGTDPARIVAGVSELLTDDIALGLMAKAENPFGDGAAAERIAGFLRRI